jgi:hypothetical protein
MLLSSALVMRLSFVHLVALPVLLSHCGSKQDLFIGEVAPAVTGAAGSATLPSSAGMSGETSAAGSAQGGLAGGGSAATPVGGAGGEAGAPEAGAGGSAGGDCVGGEEPPLDSLLHRYSFDGTGTLVVDSIAGEDGNVLGGALLDGSGVLSLAGNRDGQPDQYVDLPNGLISSLTEVTLIAWTTWRGGAGYQRIFDFGISDQGEMQGGSGRSYLAVMPSNGFTNGNGLGAEISAPGFATLALPSAEEIEDRPSVVALAYRSAVAVELFLDGKSLIRSPTAVALGDIDDRNNWLGESQWSKDHCYHGAYDEFRIYSVALTACQLRTLVARGADAL